jgi:hypothetical protein
MGGARRPFFFRTEIQHRSLQNWYRLDSIDNQIAISLVETSIFLNPADEIQCVPVIVFKAR